MRSTTTTGQPEHPRPRRQARRSEQGAAPHLLGPTPDLTRHPRPEATAPPRSRHQPTDGTGHQTTGGRAYLPTYLQSLRHSSDLATGSASADIRLSIHNCTRRERPGQPRARTNAWPGSGTGISPAPRATNATDPSNLVVGDAELLQSARCASVRLGSEMPALARRQERAGGQDQSADAAQDAPVTPSRRRNSRRASMRTRAPVRGRGAGSGRGRARDGG